MLVIHKLMPKKKRDGTDDPQSCKIRLSKMESTGSRSLEFVKYPNISNKWMNIKISIVENKISVMINTITIFQDFVELDPLTHTPTPQGINTFKGSLAFGINGVIAQFADIQVGAIKPPVDQPPSNNSSEEDEELLESEDDDPELNGQTDAIVTESSTIDKIDCVAINKKDTRMAYCNNKFNGDEECIREFATRCCVFEN